MTHSAITAVPSLLSILGVELGPLCVGLLSDVLIPSLGAQSLRYALLAPICILPVMIFALFSAERTLPDDLRAVGAQLEDDAPAAIPLARSSV